MADKPTYFDKQVPYCEAIGAHFGSSSACEFIIFRTIIDAIVLPLLCSGEGISEENLKRALKSHLNESSKLIVEHGTKLDVILGYVAANICFRQGIAALIVSPTTGK